MDDIYKKQKELENKIIGIEEYTQKIVILFLTVILYWIFSKN